jgi:CheY-like chemotaxis protein
LRLAGATRLPVTIADGGTNGLVALDTSNFDLMIVDVFMPHMRGFDSIRLFHRRVRSVPLVAISGYAFSDFEMSGADFASLAATLGATRCLRRPFRPATLLKVIDERWSAAEPHRKYVAPCPRSRTHCPGRSAARMQEAG